MKRAGTSILLPEKVQETETILVRFIRGIYLTLLPMAVKNARIAATFAAAFLLVVGVLAALFGGKWHALVWRPTGGQ